MHHVGFIILTSLYIFIPLQFFFNSPALSLLPQHEDLLDARNYGGEINLSTNRME
jgi:hypothetical protein